ncbi:MAG: ABC-2 transporter permease [Eubacteriales bacterium]|nr:ABC-2 transporter permease [Eubacteriales bacterium]
MKALILKDIASLKKTLFLTIPICLAIAAYGIYENALFMIPLICAMIPLILTSIAAGFDLKSNFEQFAFSMPIKKSSYVLSKLFFAFSFGLFGAISFFVLLSLKNQSSLENMLLIALVTLLLSVLISAIQLPFILKYGAEKGRLIMVITYFLIFALSTLLKEKSAFLSKLMELSTKYSLLMILAGVGLISLLLIGIAIKSSIVIMEKKEF